VWYKSINFWRKIPQRRQAAVHASNEPPCRLCGLRPFRPTDYPQVDMPGVWYKSVNFGEKSRHAVQPRDCIKSDSPPGKLLCTLATNLPVVFAWYKSVNFGGKFGVWYKSINFWRKPPQRRQAAVHASDGAPCRLCGLRPGLAGTSLQVRGGLVFKAHRWLYHSTLGSRVTKKKKKKSLRPWLAGTSLQVKQ